MFVVFIFNALGGCAVARRGCLLVGGDRARVERHRGVEALQTLLSAEGGAPLGLPSLLPWERRSVIFLPDSFSLSVGSSHFAFVISSISF